jgi:hypothetical protein
MLRNSAMIENPNGTARLQAELETAIVRRLLAEWWHLNQDHFRCALMTPTIALSDADGRLGRWDGGLRRIEIGRKLVLEQPWGVVVEVLKHEMAHQYVHEVLRETTETAHGPAFQRVCERLGIDATASGVPRAREDDGADGRILQRIARLLALAESPNLHEAEAAMKEAQRLMLKYNIEVGPLPAQRSYAFRHIGRVTSRVSESESLAAMILGKHFFVETIWVYTYVPLEDRQGQVLEICGTPANLEMAEYVYTFLMRTAEQLWEEHKQKHGITGNRDRRTFFAGVMRGFDEKLTQQARRHQQEGLIWRGDADLDRYLRQRNPHIRSKSFGGSQYSEAHAHGRAAGQQIVLNRPVAGETGNGGRALPPARKG